MSSNTPPSDSTANKGAEAPESAPKAAPSQPDAAANETGAAKASTAKTGDATPTSKPATETTQPKPPKPPKPPVQPQPAPPSAASASAPKPAASSPTPASNGGGAPTSPPGNSAKPHPWLGLFLLLFLVLLLANGGVNYLQWQEDKTQDQTLATLTAGQDKVAALAEELEQVRAQRLELEQRSRATEQELRRQLDQVQRRMAPLPEQMQVLMTAQAELREKVTGGNSAWRLDAVEQLLLTANERAQLAQDLRGAQQALELADLRLQSLADPAWVPLRRQIAADIAALRAVPQPDITALSLKLQALSDRVPGLPLAGHAIRSRDTQGGADAPPAEAAAEVLWYQRVWSKVQSAVGSLVTIRQNTTPTTPLLPPDLHGLLVQNLRLQLQEARTALLLRNAEQFQAALRAAQVWVEDYLEVTDPAVAAALGTMSELQATTIAPQIPDLTGSLNQLRQQRQES